LNLFLALTLNINLHTNVLIQEVDGLEVNCANQLSI